MELNGSGAGPGTDGIRISSGGGGTTIRGLVIDRFAGIGGINIEETASDNLIQGNYIGVSATGMSAAANGLFGIDVSSSGNIIGGSAPDKRNVISGNTADGIRIEATAASNLIQGNYIGTDAGANSAIPNGTGISVLGAGNMIGGATAGAGNVISGNTSLAIVLSHSASVNNTVQGNLIGADDTGVAPVGNGRGIQVESGSSSNLIGGSSPSAGNLIAHNRGVGLSIVDTGTTTVSSNAIFDNALPGGSDKLGIDLGLDQVTLNDPQDSDTGPNGLQNYPLITSATNTGTNTVVSGSLNSTPNRTYRIEFFSNEACDTSGFGEGEIYIGTTDVTTGGSGSATYASVMLPPVVVGRTLTATATDPSGNTSEFSQCRQVEPPGGPTIPGAPPAPTALAGDAQATVSWIAPSSNGGSAITSYTVTASPGGQSVNVDGSTFSAVVTGLTNGTSYTFTVEASNAIGSGLASVPSNPVTPTAPLALDATRLSVGGTHSCFLTSTGGAKCWGSNTFGQLGDGSTTGRVSPVDVTGLSSGVSSISAGGLHTCAVNSAGGMKCWGHNGYGQLGDGTNTNRSTPTSVPGLASGVVAVSAGQWHTCALMGSGSVVCWGLNQSAQLGDGTTTNRSGPVGVSSLSSGVVAISAGSGSHMCPDNVGWREVLGLELARAPRRWLSD